ncbi:hypothetical protein OG21DRAFT_954705 [Imleria badia]|nr:hypothetical protein OG21DRAFT_954705 [Imleria badia]
MWLCPILFLSFSSLPTSLHPFHAVIFDPVTRVVVVLDPTSCGLKQPRTNRFKAVMMRIICVQGSGATSGPRRVPRVQLETHNT